MSAAASSLVHRPRPLARKLRGVAASDGAAVKLTRVTGGPDLEALDPFLLLDEFGSDDPDAYIGGLPDHPHPGFETITVMLAGRMRHRDSKGNKGLLEPGAVQWMTAGRGLVHSEMPEQQEGLMRGFQLWLNLPARLKMTAPRYQDIPPEAVPQVELPDGVKVRVIAGEVAGAARAVPLDPEVRPTEPYLLDVELPPGAAASVRLPKDHNVFAYVYAGRLSMGRGEVLARSELAVLGPGDGVEVEAGEEGASLLLAAARPLNEPVARYGPFVLNSREEIIQAVEDFREGRF